ncbi:hypothetical protein [Sporosarcina sp. FA9]|uniref:hypothetical protein n=1 Tax=Sporosarcina sp. FA9 TaxID=3413030 RepID=UPI003F65A553
MSAVLANATVNNQLQRYDAVRRKNADNAYNRTSQYNGQNRKTVEDLKALLTGENEIEIVQTKRKEKSVESNQPEQQSFQLLNAGLLKQVALPVGNTLEETINIWRGLRSEAISTPEPTIADHQFAAKASAEIMYTEAKIALHNLAKKFKDLNTDGNKMSASTYNDARDTSQLERFEKAVSTYSFQTQMKQNGFKMTMPDFSQTA